MCTNPLPFLFINTQEDDDLLPEEFDDIWNRAPKFPDTAVATDIERIDVDSFVQIYRDIDDLFESEEEEKTVAAPSKQKELESLKDTSIEASTEVETEEYDNEEDETLEAELEAIFEQISDKDGLVSKEALRQWDEVAKLLSDGLLGEDEFDDLWDKTKKSSRGSTERQTLDVDGFLSFNVALDCLFDFEDEEVDEDEAAIEPEYDEENENDERVEEIYSGSVEMIEGDALSPTALFAALANLDGLVGPDELKRWGELREMIEEGDLLESELDEMYAKAKKSEKDMRKLDEAGFITFYQEIDDLFEDDDGEENAEGDSGTTPPRTSRSVKDNLLVAIQNLAHAELLPCGLEATEREQKQILAVVNTLENEPSNLVRQRQGQIEPEDLAGTWDLLYSSSSAFRYNKGLSGLGGSFPNGKFGGVQQRLQASKFLMDVEYIERIEVNPSTASFDVTVTGTWDLRTSVSLFTGDPSIVMTVVPDRVMYGPTSTRADHWKSLGPMNMLDVCYLDDDLRIMRGNTSVDTIFVFRRTNPAS
jgi:hypothetical protein